MKEARHIKWFVLGWIVLNCIQAIFLDITPDEAYYFIYAQDLSWGYFDHPPVVAFFVKLGTMVLPGTLGVRLPFIILSGISIYLLYLLTETRRPQLFGMTILSMIAFHLFGFHALPDVPLIFFSLIFLLGVKHYLEQDSWVWALGLAITIPLMLLSKYYGVLLIGFTVLAAPQFIGRKSFWLIVCLSLLFMLPHLHWQYTHDFQTFRFHLFERNWKAGSYQVTNTLLYLALQFVVAGPLIGFLLIRSAFSYQVKDPFDRILKTSLIGIYGFFFLMTFGGGDVHPHWTTLAILPLVILAIKYLDQHVERFQQSIKRIFWPSIVILLIGRSLLVYDFIPQPLLKHERVHGIDRWAQAFAGISEGRPIVFPNSYQRASRYIFYTHQKATSLGNIMSRRSQFDLMPVDTAIFGKEVCLILPTRSTKVDSLSPGDGKKYSYRFVDNYVYYPHIRIKTPKRTFKVDGKGPLLVPIQVINHHYSQTQLAQHPRFIPKVSYHIFKQGKKIMERKTATKVVDIQNRAHYTDFDLSIPTEPGKYILKFGVWCGWLPPTENSTILHIVVE